MATLKTVEILRQIPDRREFDLFKPSALGDERYTFITKKLLHDLIRAEQECEYIQLYSWLLQQSWDYPIGHRMTLPHGVHTPCRDHPGEKQGFVVRTKDGWACGSMVVKNGKKERCMRSITAPSSTSK